MGRSVSVHDSVLLARPASGSGERGRAWHETLFFGCVRFCFLFPVIALADSTALIIQGVGGSDAHEKKFAKWSTGTRDVLVQDLGFFKGSSGAAVRRRHAKGSRSEGH